MAQTVPSQHGKSPKKAVDELFSVGLQLRRDLAVRRARSLLIDTAIRGFIITLAFISAAVPAQAAARFHFESYYNKTNNIRYALHIDGVFELGDGDRAFNYLQDSLLSGKIPPGTVEFLVLNSTGGTISEAAPLAEGLVDAREQHPGANTIASYVSAQGVCASACFLLFACAEPKYAHINAHIGIHSARNENGQEDEGSLSADTQMGRLLNRCHVPPYLIVKMLTTPPNETYWLTPTDLRAMNVRIEGQTPPRCPSNAMAAYWLCAMSGTMNAFDCRARIERRHQCVF